MLLVETYVKPSKIHGLGLFSKYRIKKHETIWVFDKKFDKVFSENDLLTFPDHVRDYIRWYGFKSINGKSKNKWILSSDNDRYQNSSSSLKNMIEDVGSNLFTDNIISSRTINADEELISDYTEWDSSKTFH